MKLRWIAVGMVLVLLAGAAGAAAQAEKKAPAKARTYDFKALLERIAEAWSATDATKGAPYYAQEPGHVYYDITPMKYNGWQEYAEGYKKVVADYSSVKFALGPDAEAHQLGNIAWTTTTWKAEMIKKDGTKDSMEGRWTAIFEKRGEKWIIVHDHFSVPLPPPPAPAKQ